MAGVSKSLRAQVLVRDGMQCQEQSCGVVDPTGGKLHVDHRMPRSEGGTDDMANLQTLCENCNLGKSDNAERAEPKRQRSVYIPESQDNKLIEHALSTGEPLNRIILRELGPLLESLPEAGPGVSRPQLHRGRRVKRRP